MRKIIKSNQTAIKKLACSFIHGFSFYLEKLHSVIYFVISGCFVIFQCLSLLLWLEERYETVYTRHTGFQKGSKPLLALDNPFPMELPDNLFGDKWAFVQLPFSGEGLVLLL